MKSLSSPRRSPSFLRRPLSTLLVFVLIVIAFLSVIPTAEAAVSVWNTVGTRCLGPVGTCTSASLAIHASGDIVYVAVASYESGSSCSDLNAPTDSTGDTFSNVITTICASQTGSTTQIVTVYFFTTASTTSRTITVTGGASADLYVWGVDTSGTVSTAAATISMTTGCLPSCSPVALDCSSLTYCPVQMATTTYFGSGSFLLAAYINYGWGGTYVPGSGFQAVAAGQSALEYNIGNGNVISPTTFPETCQSCGAAVQSSGVAVVFGSAGAGPSPNQTQTIGSCPSSPPGTFTMVNSTIYMYYGNSLGSEVVNTVSTEIDSIVGSGSHTIQLLVYVSSGVTASVATPLTLAYSRSFVITSGTTNSIITAQVNIQVSSAVPFNLWGVGIVGDNKVVIKTSSLSGLFTQSGNPSTAAQPNSFTSQGATSVTKLYLCATANYQSALGTTTVTTAASTTVTTSSTVTVSSIGPTLFTSASNWPVIFLILVLPAGLFLGATRTLAGALLGLMIGAVIGVMMGILPIWVFTLMVIGMVATAFILRQRSG